MWRNDRKHKYIQWKHRHLTTLKFSLLPSIPSYTGHSLCKICRTSAPGWQWSWIGKWGICWSCWTGNNLCELKIVPTVETCNWLQHLQFYYLCRFLGLHGFKVFTDTVVPTKIHRLHAKVNIIPWRPQNASWWNLNQIKYFLSNWSKWDTIGIC